MRYQHDCNLCIPLGEFGKYDLYFCNKKGIQPTVIARYGNGDPEYISGMEFAKTGRSPELAMALLLARKKGLLTH